MVAVHGGTPFVDPRHEDRLTYYRNARPVTHFDHNPDDTQCIFCGYETQYVDIQGRAHEVTNNGMDLVKCEACDEPYYLCWRCDENGAIVRCPCLNCWQKEQDNDYLPYCSLRCWAEMEEEGLCREV